MWDFPGGPVVKNPPCKVGDTDLIAGWEDPTCHGEAKPEHHNSEACMSSPLLTASFSKAHT